MVRPGGARQDYADVVFDVAGLVEDGERRAALTSSDQFPASFASDDSYWNEVASRVRDRFGNVAWFAVYDGHGTGKIAQLAAHYLPYVLAKSIAEQDDNALPVIMKGMPREVHQIIKRQALEGIGIDVRDAGGTTATMAVVADGQVHVGTVGDSVGMIRKEDDEVVDALPQSMDLLPKSIEAEFSKANMLYADLAGRSYRRVESEGHHNSRVGITGLRMYGSIGDYHCDMDVVNAMVRHHRGKFDPNDDDIRLLSSLTNDHRAIWQIYVPRNEPFRSMTSDPFRREPDKVASTPIDGSVSMLLATDRVLWLSFKDVEQAETRQRKIDELRRLCSGASDSDAAVVYVEFNPAQEPEI